MSEVVKGNNRLKTLFAASGNASGVGINGIKIKYGSVRGCFRSAGLNSRPLDAETKGVEPETTRESEVISVSVPKIHGAPGAGDTSGVLAVGPVITGLTKAIVAPLALVARGRDTDEK